MPVYLTNVQSVNLSGYFTCCKSHKQIHDWSNYATRKYCIMNGCNKSPHEFSPIRMHCCSTVGSYSAKKIFLVWFQNKHIFILKFMILFYLTGDENPLMYHRVAESFKWAYAQRSKLGDPFDTDITQIVNEVSCIYRSRSSSYAKSHY